MTSRKAKSAETKETHNPSRLTEFRNKAAQVRKVAKKIEVNLQKKYLDFSRKLDSLKDKLSNIPLRSSA